MTDLTSVGDACEIVGGGTPSRKRPDFFGGTIPWVTIKDLRGHIVNEPEEFITEAGLLASTARIVDEGAVLVATRVGLGKVALAGRRLAINQDIKALRPRHGMMPEFLYWHMLAHAPQIERMGVGATVKGITLGDLRALPLRVPSIDEQRNIVDLLNRAESLKRLGEQAQETASELIPALFVDMFGDPATNPKGWATAKLGKLGRLDRGRSKHRPRNDPALFGGHHPFIQTGDVAAARGVIRTAKQYYSDAGLAQSRMWPAGTLCITIAANIAQTGVLSFPACFPDSVVGFTPAEGVSTRYIQHFIDHLRPYLERTAPQLAQKNINLEILRDVQVPVPPSELQHQFDAHLARAEAVEQTAHIATAIADRTSVALMSRLFAG